jgi:hypothetical protein
MNEERRQVVEVERERVQGILSTTVRTLVEKLVAQVDSVFDRALQQQTGARVCLFLSFLWKLIFEHSFKRS